MTKQEVLNYLDNVLHPIVSPDNWNVYSELHDMIEELETAELVRHGKWINTHGKEEWYCTVYKCSVCGCETLGNDDKFCGGCGARMDAE